METHDPKDTYCRALIAVTYQGHVGIMVSLGSVLDDEIQADQLLTPEDRGLPVGDLDGGLHVITLRPLFTAQPDMPPEMADLEWQLVESRRPNDRELIALAEGHFAHIQKTWAMEGIKP